MPTGFAPLIYPDTRLLIIGSMPGEVSLHKQEYYGHPQNAFWRIIADVFHQGMPFESYTEKCAVLRQNHIGLWDSLASCLRKGSMDADIKKAIVNNFTPYTYIPVFLFNGQAAFKYFKKANAPLLQNHIYKIMPSTSPAYASLSYTQKKEIWTQNLYVK